MRPIGSVESVLFSWLRETHIRGDASREAFSAVETAMKAGEALSLAELASKAGCDERNFRNHVKEFEEAARRAAGTRMLAVVDFNERSRGKQIAVVFRAVLHPEHGHSLKFLHGFAGLPKPAAPGRVRLHSLKRKKEPSSYAAGRFDLALTLCENIRQFGTAVDRDESVGRVISASDPAIVICSPSDLRAADLPGFAQPLTQPMETPPECPKRTCRYAEFHIARFLSEHDPAHPVLIIASDDDYAPRGFENLILRNDAAARAWTQAGLADDELPPEEFHMKVRFELDRTTNRPNGAGAPQVLEYGTPPPPSVRPADVKPFRKRA